MTEKEKMKQGLLYDANYDSMLLEERNKAKALCMAYNQTSPYQTKERENMIRQLFGKTGKHFCIEPTFFCDYGYHITIGENFFMNHNCVILDCAAVTFGDNVFIAPNCGFYTAGHPLDAEQRNAGLEYAYPITVGNHVWIGGNVVVLPGAVIEDYAVIGAGSVVTGRIPANVIAAGNPCRTLRPITEGDKHKYDVPKYK